jgi:hypothetical protein
MNPNRESTTVPTEGWFRLLRDRGLEPILVSNQSGAFQAWASEQGIPCYQVPLPFPDWRRPWPFLRSLVRVVQIGRRHAVQLVHCNEHDIYPIGQYVARLLRVPVVLSVHFAGRLLAMGVRRRSMPGPHLLHQSGESRGVSSGR